MGDASGPAPVLRPLYLALGILCVGLGYIGFFVPLMPSTVFFLIALWAFQRSSPKLERWILEESPVGPAMKEWRRTKSLSRKTKVIAISSVWVGIGVSIAVLASKYAERPTTPWVIGGLGVTAICLTAFLATRSSGDTSATESA